MKSRNRRFPIPMIGMLFIIGILTASRTIGRERMGGVATVDIVSLMGAGFCLGVAVGLLAMFVARQREEAQPQIPLPRG